MENNQDIINTTETLAEEAIEATAENAVETVTVKNNNIGAMAVGAGVTAVAIGLISGVVYGVKKLKAKHKAKKEKEAETTDAEEIKSEETK